MGGVEEGYFWRFRQVVSGGECPLATLVPVQAWKELLRNLNTGEKFFQMPAFYDSQLPPPVAGMDFHHIAIKVFPI